MTQAGSNSKQPATALKMDSAGIDSQTLSSWNRPVGESRRRPVSARAARNTWGSIKKSSLEHAQKCEHIDVMQFAKKGGAIQITDIYASRLASARRAEEHSWHATHRQGGFPLGSLRRETGKNYARRKSLSGSEQYRRHKEEHYFDEEEAYRRQALQIPVAIAARAREEEVEALRVQETFMAGLIQEVDEDAYSDAAYCVATNNKDGQRGQARMT